MARSLKELQNEALSLFMDNFKGKNILPLKYFHMFLCPVAAAEAMVKEHIIEDYDFLELLILRLYDAGFHDVEQLTTLSGMKREVVKKVLENEIMVYRHISMEDGVITEMGRKTLEENAAGALVTHTMYSTPRRLQIEAATGTVIPGYLEEKVEYMKTILDDKADSVVPRESVEQDEELRREINERILEYKHMDILNEGNTIQEIEKLWSTQIFYRWAYLAQFEGMKYPMIVMRGYRSISNVNAESVKKSNFGYNVAVPLAIARTDAGFLKKHGMQMEDVLVREDNAFEYLLEKTIDFNVKYEAEELHMEMEPIVYEDERIADTESGEDEVDLI